jgi:hypothetical protein
LLAQGENLETEVVGRSKKSAQVGKERCQSVDSSGHKSGACV